MNGGSEICSIMTSFTKARSFRIPTQKTFPIPSMLIKLYGGGTGYAITTKDGREVYTKEEELSPEVEKMRPDYTIYPEYDFAISMTTRGCPRGCDFCIVGKKEGRCSKKVADVCDFYDGQKRIEVLDPNITACKERFDLYEQYIDTNATITFNQGLDIRMITERDIEYLNRMKTKEIHFAWDNPRDDLKGKFEMFSEAYAKSKNHIAVFCLTNFHSTLEEDLYRIYTLRDLGFYPYVMIYDKPNAPKEIKRLQRWVNNRFIFKSCPRFEDYE